MRGLLLPAGLEATAATGHAARDMAADGEGQPPWGHSAGCSQAPAVTGGCPRGFAEALVPREGTKPALSTSLGDESPRGSRCLHRETTAMAALQLVPRLQQSVSGKALLLLSPPEGRGAIPGEARAATRDLPWAALPSRCPDQPEGKLESDTKAELLNSPCQAPELRREQREPQGSGREAARTATAVNTSHFNCLNDALRDGCGTQQCPEGLSWNTAVTTNPPPAHLPSAK